MARATLISGGRSLGRKYVSPFQPGRNTGIGFKKRKGNASAKPPPTLKPYQCGVCGRKFSTDNGRAAHHAAVHEAPRIVPKPKSPLLRNRGTVESARANPTPVALTPVIVVPPPSPETLAARLPKKLKNQAERVAKTHVACPVCGQIVGKGLLGQHMRRKHPGTVVQKP